MSDYEPRWDLDYARGRQAEDWIKELGAETIEVKHDQRAIETGNVFVEYECKGKPSGIRTTKAKVWAFVIDNHKVAVFVAVPVLLAACKALWRTNTKEMTRGSHPTKGVVIPINRLLGMMK